MKSKWSIILFLLVLGKAAFAACPNPVPANVACVRWQPSTGWSTGVPYRAGTVITYHVVLHANGQVVRTLTTTTGLDATIRGLPAGQHCFAVFAKVTPVDVGASDTSALSNVACKTLRFPGPTDGSIVGPTDGSIEQPRR
jgi:hypothetical protein